MDYTEIWTDYEKCKNYLTSEGLYHKSEKCHDFVDGEQWKGLSIPKGMDRPPQLNILQPIMKSATALVGQNSMEITFSPLNKTSDKQKYIAMCEALNKFVADTWERLHFDGKMWDVLEDAYTVGDAFIYFYWTEDGIKAEFLDNISVLFGDENNPNIQEQPYIYIPQRKYVTDVKAEAEKNGISKEEIANIVPDDDTDNLHGTRREIKNDTKVTVITKMWKKDGVLHIMRATKTVVYQEDTVYKTKDGGISMYPLVKYSWKPRKYSARGAGDVWDKIPNQIEINKGVYRFCQAVKTTSFPVKVFLETAFSDKDIAKLDVPGSSIGVRGNTARSVGDMVTYLQPGNISPYAANIWQTLIELTRNLAGAGDNLENINPEQASGSAINAAREAKALNVNGQVAAYKQFLEDIALIWADLWKTYNAENVVMKTNSVTITIPPTEFRNLKPSVRVDISPNTPFSKLAQETELKELFVAGHITFEEYVGALSDNSNVPKAKLQAILEARKEMQIDEMSTLSNGDVQGQSSSTGPLFTGGAGTDYIQMPEPEVQ